MILKKGIFLQMLFVAILSLPVNVNAEQLDPKFKDDAIWRIHRVFGMNGALQLDRTAVEGGANEWQINVELLELEGETKQVVDKNWDELLLKEQHKIVTELRNWYPDEVPESAKVVDAKLLKKLSQETDGTFFVQKGVDKEIIRKWILEELLTSAGFANTKYFLEGERRKRFEFYRYHMDDTSAEIIGNDLLLIRGVKKVLIIRMSYTHS